jgi:hypothetical protein
MQFATLEAQQKELAAALEDPAAYQPGGRPLRSIAISPVWPRDLARLTAEWESVTGAVTSDA